VKITKNKYADGRFFPPFGEEVEKERVPGRVFIVGLTIIVLLLSQAFLKKVDLFLPLGDEESEE
jgi:hypothetical protein